MSQKYLLHNKNTNENVKLKFNLKLNDYVRNNTAVAGAVSSRSVKHPLVRTKLSSIRSNTALHTTFPYPIIFRLIFRI